jgi:chromosome segregation ATPase
MPKQDSPLVQSVLTLQTYLDELERVGNKINATDMTADVDVEFVQKLLSRFAECGQALSQEIGNLSAHLQQAQVSAQAVAEGVSRQAEAFQSRTVEQQEQLEKFRQLGERVRNLNTSVSQFRQSTTNGHAEDNRAALAASIPGIERELVALISELHSLRESARASCMKKLEKDAESLAQTLQAVHEKLKHFADGYAL